ncbi:MAG: AsmA family protein, partial [Planctomycetes bacterium]|nr:AsmA family protein [Planctomycetota bacterium]
MSDENKQNVGQKKSVIRRIGKAVVVALVVLFVLLAASVVIGPALVSTAAVERVISESTQENLGRPAKLGDFSMSLIGGARVVLSDLVIEDKKEYGDEPLLQIDKLTLDADILPLLRKKLVINNLTIEGPRISVVKGEDGRLNLADLPLKKEPAAERLPDEEALSAAAIPAFKITNLAVRNGTVRFADRATGETSQIRNLEAELIAEAEPADKLGEITKARLWCDGLEIKIGGKMVREKGKSVVKNFAVDSTLDITALGKSASAVLPVNVVGGLEYQLRANGPISALSTKSVFTLTDFQASGARLRKPANITSLVIEQRAMLDLERMGAEYVFAEITSDGPGISGKVTGKIDSLLDAGNLDLKITGNVDIAKLSNFADSFTPKPLTADGQLTFDTMLVGDPRKKLAAKGKLLAANIRLETPGMTTPFMDPRIDLIYDVTVTDGTSANIKELKVRSRLMNADATGNYGPGAADLVASARADLASLGSALAGMGLLPQDMLLEGRFDAGLRAKTAEGGGIAVTADGTVKDFALATPQMGEKFTEPEMTFGASGLLGFAEGKLDTIRRSQLTFASRIGNARGKVVADKLATEPSFACDLVAAADLKSVGEALVRLGIIEKGRNFSGKLQASMTVATRDRRPEKKGAHAPGQERLIGDPALDANDPPALAGLGAGAALPMQAGHDAPVSARIAADATVTGESIIYDNIKIDKIDSKLRFEERIFNTDGTVQLYQGRVAFSEATNLQNEQPTHNFKLKVEKVLLTRELSDFFSRVIPLLPLPLGQIEGRLDADAETLAKGIKPEELFAGLNGSGTVA